MKSILIVFFLFLCYNVVAQQRFPSGPPTQFSTGFFRQGYPMSDSGLIVANRDTNWLAKYSGTVVFKPSNKKFYWFDSTTLTWNQFGTVIDTTSLSNRINLKQDILSNTTASGDTLLIGNSIKRVQNDYGLTFSTNATKVLMFIDTLGSNHVVTTSQLKDTAAAIRAAIGSGTGLTSVGLSMPSAFSVSGSPLTSNGTINVSGAGAASEYIRGNGTLATTDTTMIPSFYLKVRGLFSGTSPIAYNSTTGAISIPNADITGTKGAATFNSAYFTTNGSGLIGLTLPVSAGSCTGCTLNIGADGRITSYADGAGGATNNANIGTGFRWLNGITQELRTAANSPTITWDSVSTANTLTAKVDTSIIATQFDISTKLNSSDTTNKWINDIRRTPGSVNVEIFKNGVWTTAYTDSVGAGSGGATLNNIGAGYRLVATSAGNIKTLNSGYGILHDSTTVSNTITTKVDTTTIDGRYPKVYNVALYGATPDGKEKYDGAMTSGSATLTCVSCSFTAQDVGKAIRVEGAITNGDLVTTIAGFTNSSTVTLGSSATRTVSGDTLVYGTDNTAYIQAAINDAFTYGNGIVYIPGAVGFGFYVIAGALVTSYLGTNPNAQLIWPIADLGGSSFNQRKHVLIQGSNPAYNTPSAWGSDTLTAKYGTTLYSIIDGTGTLPSVFATKGITSGYGFFNYNEISFKNLAILVARNKYNNGPSVGGINGLYSSTTNVDDVLIGISGSIYKQPEPTHDVAALIVGKKDSEIYSHIRNVSAFSFKYGFIYAEDVVVDKAIAHACIYGHTMTDGNYPIVATSLDAHWCRYSLYVPNYNLFGLIPLSTGVTNFNINYLSSEVFTGSFMGSPTWLNYSKIVLDSGSRGRGTVDAWNIGEAGVGLNNALFNKYGGDSIFTHQVGSRVDPNPYSWTNRTTFNYINKLGASQNSGAEGYFYNWSPLSDASILRSQPTVANGSQGLYLSPSGSGASSVSPLQSWINLFNIPQWTGENTVNSSSEVMTLASAGTRHYISTSASGSGIVRPLSIETGANTDQIKLNTNGSVEINGNNSNQLSVIGSSATRISGYFRNTNASGNTSLYFDNSRGSFAAYGGILTGGASDATGNIFGYPRADMTFMFHDGASGAGMGIGTLNNQVLALGTNNTERIRVSGPGVITFNSAYSFPTSNGTDGYVLTAHTGGAATWDAPGGSGNTIYTGDGTLGADRNVASGGFTLRFSGTNNSDTLVSIVNSGTSSTGLYVLGASRGIDAQSGSGTGVNAYGEVLGLNVIGNTNAAIQAQSNATVCAHLITNVSSTNTVQEVLRIDRAVASGSGADGVGGSIDYYTEASGGTSLISNQLISQWSTAASGSRVSRFSITGVNNTTTNTLLTIDGDGSVTTTGKRIMAVSTSSAGTLTLGNAEAYIFNGTTTTWTLPAVSGTTGRIYYIKNIGSGSITLNADSGNNEIYSTSAVNTVTVTAGSSLILISNGTYFTTNP